jgi:regulator of sigma D
MANRKTTQLTELTDIQNDDWFYVIDKSDTTESPQGTSKKIKKSNTIAFIKSNESLSLAQRKGDVLYGVLDQYTGEDITLSKVTGTPTVDGIIYFQLGSEYFKRVENDSIDSKMFGDLPISNVKMAKDQYEGKANTYLIKNQAEFDNINTIVNANVVSKFYIKGGTYEYNNYHVVITNKTDSKDIIISAAIGEEVNLIPKGEKYQIKESVSETETHFVCNLKDNAVDFRTVSFIDENLNDVKKSTTGIRKADSLVTIVDSGLKKAKFKMPAELSYIFNKDTTYFKDSTLRITSLWRLNNCKIISSDADGYLYFTYDLEGLDDTYFQILYNNNNLQTAQFSIDNVFTAELKEGITINDNKIYIPKNILLLHASKGSNFLSVVDSTINKIQITNLNFKSTSYYVNNTFGLLAPLFAVNGSNNLTVDNNYFSNQKSFIIRTGNSNNVVIKNNEFNVSGPVGNIYGNNTIVCNNKVKGSDFVGGESLFVLLGINVNFYKNVVKNYIYHSISLNGLGDTSKTLSGNVYENLIYNDAEFSNMPNFSLNDGGAIYVNNISAGVVNIYDNVIHDIRGNDFYSIYLDDGSSNVNVKNNLIYNVNYTSISARNAVQAGVSPDETLPCTNVNIEYNIIETFPWIGTPSTDTNCKFNNNVLLSPNAVNKPTFNFYDGKITASNYEFLNNKYSNYDIKNDKLRIDDPYYKNRGSFINSFLDNVYPKEFDYLMPRAGDYALGNITTMGVPASYSATEKYYPIDLFFLNPIENVDSSFKLTTSQAYNREEFLISVSGATVLVKCLTNNSFTSNIDAVDKVLGINYKTFPINGIYNSGVTLFIKTKGLISHYHFSEIKATDVNDILNANLFVNYGNNLIDSLPVGTTNCYEGIMTRLSATSAEYNSGGAVAVGHKVYDTGLQRVVEFTRSNATDYIWKIIAGNYGTFANKPTSTNAEIGHQYFCTDKQTAEGATNGIPIYHKGSGVWVDALGRVVS